MTHAEAKQELKRKLAFGDAKQIQAVRILEKVSACIELIEACNKHHEESLHGLIYEALDDEDLDVTQSFVCELRNCCCEDVSDKILEVALQELKTRWKI